MKRAPLRSLCGMQQLVAVLIRPRPPTLPPTPQYFESDAADVYEVACIVGHKIENYVDMYRVHWAAYSHTEDT